MAHLFVVVLGAASSAATAGAANRVDVTAETGVSVLTTALAGMLPLLIALLAIGLAVFVVKRIIRDRNREK